MDGLSPGADHQPAEQFHVLVVEATGLVGDRLRSALAKAEPLATVDQVASGADALARQADGGFDAVVVVDERGDGGLDGLDLLTRLRDVGEGLAVVYVPADGDVRLDEAIDRGVDRCLVRQTGSAGWDRALAHAVVSEVEHRRTLALLEATRDEFRRINDTVPVMVTRKDTQNRLLTVNEAVAEYLDRPKEEIEGKTAWELFPDAAETFYEMDRRVIESGEPIDGEVQPIETPSGDERWMRTHAVPYRDDDGAVAGVLVVSEDITELKERELELARQNERLDAFTSVVSHDLRNPLNVAQGRLELAREECESEHLPPIADAHERIAQLIENLLTLAQDGDDVDAPEPVALATLVADSWAGVDTGEASLDATLDRTVIADESRLRQVFENLFRNAVTHGGSGVTVRVGQLADGFYVEDDGPGLPAGEAGEVFEVGFSTTPRSPGFGLSIVGEIVGAHGWTVRATDGTDGGARFEVSGVEFVDD